MELKIQGLSKTYPNGVRALDSVSLTIPRGMYGLLGRWELLPNPKKAKTMARSSTGSVFT